MAKSLFLSRNSSGANVGFGLTRSYWLGMGAIANITTETNAQTTFRTNGTLTNLYVFISTNTNNGTSTYKTRKNVGDGSMSVSITSSTTGKFEDTSNSDAITAGEEWNYQLITGGTSGNIVIRHTGSIYEVSGNVVHRMGAGDISQGFSTASATVFNCIGGSFFWDTVETDVQYKFQTAGTLRNLFIVVSANARGTASTVGTKKNGATTGNLTMSIGASATGIFEDISNTDVVADNDLWVYTLTTGTGTGSITSQNISCEFTTVNNRFHFSCHEEAGVAYGSTLQQVDFASVAGILITRLETEVACQQEANLSMVFSNMEVYVNANTAANNATVRLRKNGNNGTESLSVTASTTGWFEDTAGIDNIAETDLINYSIDLVTLVDQVLNINTFAIMAVATSIKTVNDLAKASVKTINGLAIASIKTVNDLA